MDAFRSEPKLKEFPDLYVAPSPLDFLHRSESRKSIRSRSSSRKGFGIPKATGPATNPEIINETFHDVKCSPGEVARAARLAERRYRHNF